jgi:peptidoglycan hydrolase-like protein with peptidoglycan-binding domain
MTLLSLHSTGPEVTALQTLLIAAGFDPADAHGVFGPGTEKAVLAYQEKHDLLTVDGLVEWPDGPTASTLRKETAPPESTPSPTTPPTVAAKGEVGPLAMALIITQEAGSEAWYTANAAHPVVPSSTSGVTVGIGYDCGQQSDATILKDWIAVLGEGPATVLSRCAGLTGAHAETALRFVRHVVVPWPAALTVFQTSTLPRYAAQTWAALPNCALLTPDAFGALVSIGYNRGNGGWERDDSEFSEMFAIRNYMWSKDFARIPAEIVAMKRIWPDTESLRKRRAGEAALFEAAMAKETA